MPSELTKVKVLLIGGSQRSGSTILTTTLGELQDTFAVGELNLVWRYSYIDNGQCGCGQSFADCEIWREVTSRAYGDASAVDARWMIDNRPRLKHSPLMLVPGGRAIVNRRFGRYLATLDRLYQAVASVTGSRIIVDSSKALWYRYLLGLLPSVELYVVHLVRDPHGVQHSIMRRKAQGDPRFQQHSVARSTLMWDVHNLSQELLGRQDRDRYLRVHYEEFVSDPHDVIQRIGAFMGEPGWGLPPVEDNQIQLGTNHTVAASTPRRFESGPISFQLDTRWRTEMDERERALVTRLSLPLLHRYGYSR